ncbi:Transmembrane protein [Pseudolycoriella hygida]|uniref:Transmembrane protein n=1 Tax=Pseudolycoriella hygida TaxID=35572 RepID=A0A9Q0N0G6_9DIPT|nr:Transmembrane protein [Pseudolycoriella hygida]
MTGRSNVLILPIYGFGFLLLEAVASHLQRTNVSIYKRGLIYTLMAYMFEFGTGYFMLMIGQSFWDYSDFAYNVKGIIMPHTGPGWFIVELVGERFIIDRVQRLTLTSN